MSKVVKKIRMINSKKVPGIRFRIETIGSKKFIDVVLKDSYESIANLGSVAPIKGPQKDFVNKIEEVLSQLDWTLQKEEIHDSAEHYKLSQMTLFDSFNRVKGYFELKDNIL